MLLEEVNMAEFKRLIKKTKTLIIPFGTVEAHGTHLPLNTDTVIIREAVRKAASETGVFMAPAIEYGVCTSTSMHPGTIGITPDTLRSIVRDIVRDGYRHGLRRFILISGHGGGLHVNALREAAETLVGELDGISMAACSVYEILGKEAYSIAETKNDSHAGEMETSLMLFLAPELVKGRSRQEYPSFPKPLVVKDKLRYWKGAVWGNPEAASRDKGERLFGFMVTAIKDLVVKIGKVR